MYKLHVVYGTITLYGRPFQTCSTIQLKSMLWSYNPQPAVTGWVWALARSLATTCAITFVFFSSSYLDVSVQRVCFSTYVKMTCLQHAGLPHSEILGYNVYLPLPQAYRSLSRPSSPLRA
jgi:hypothetical protein